MCATAIVLFLYWGVCAGKMIGATEINIFEDEKESAPKKSSWQEKLDKMQKVHAEKESVIKDHIK